MQNPSMSAPTSSPPPDSAEPGIAAPGRLRTTFRALQHRNFQLFFGGQLISLTGARIVGPAMAGLVVARIGEGWCFFSNGVSYIAVIIGLLMMRVHCPRRSGELSPFESLREGFQFVNRTVPIRALLLLLGVVSLVCMPYTVLMPIFADKILHGGPKALGTLMGATGIGAMFGALTLASRKDVRGLGRWVAVSAGLLGCVLM